MCGGAADVCALHPRFSYFAISFISSDFFKRATEASNGEEGEKRVALIAIMVSLRHRIHFCFAHPCLMQEFEMV